MAASARSIITPNLMLVPERRTKLCRISPVDGGVVWASDLQNAFGWLAASDSSCTYLNQHSCLQCFEADNGVERWRVDLSGRHGDIFGHVCVAADCVIVGGWRGYSDIIALSLEDGAVLWTKSTYGRSVKAPVAGPDETLLLAFPEDDESVLVSALTGKEHARWSCPRTDNLPDGSPFVVRHGDSFLCISAQGGILALDPRA